MKNKIMTAVAGIVLAVSLTGCGNSTPEVVETPTPTETTVSTPTPTDTQVAVELDASVISERNAAGDFILPDGSTKACPEESNAVLVYDNGVVECDLGVEW